ncbi:MAG: glutathione S-transferase family protein [Betaproteobacteria bacterium]|nr:glutathione S-transferase family protein [Betaproteobacteria bacterium]
MQLIGMLDSPYVRRVAISMRLMGLPFEHRSLSVFRHVDTFKTINPLVKAPTLVCDDGEVLMDSSLILDYLEGLVSPEKRLLPASGQDRRDALQHISVALVAYEKTVQRYYELTLRPSDKQHQPWLDRVSAQMADAFDWLERIVADASPWLRGERLMQDDVTIAVAWRFTQFITPGVIDPAHYPHLAAFSARAETLPDFVATPLD